MKALRILISMLVIVVAISVFPEKIRGANYEALTTADFEKTFTNAQDIFYKLLLPNSMARTTPRSKREEEKLLQSFQGIAATFKNHANISVPFLKAKVASTLPDAEDPALCALQLLFEINDQASWKVIRDAQSNPHEVVAEWAKEMVKHKQDVLWGFRSQK